MIRLFSRPLRNVAKGWTELPEVPANVGVIFPNNSYTVRPFYVTDWKWGMSFAAMCFGLYTGQKLAINVLTRRNPPNPARMKDSDQPPAKHPHTVDED